MIHLNVTFLVVPSTLQNFVKILINASPHAVNKCTSDGLFCTCDCYNMLDEMYHVHYKGEYIQSTGVNIQVHEFMKFLKVSFVS